MKERELIINKYEEMFDKSLIARVESETSGHFQVALVAVLESSMKNREPNYEEDVNQLKEAMYGAGTDEDAIIRIIASKSDEQCVELLAKFTEMTGEDLYKRVDS